MARVLVVGATGYLGSHMVTELKAAGHWVRALSRRKGAFDGATRAPDEVFVGQATRRETLDGLCDGIDYVFSALGQTRQKDKQSFWDVDYGANKAVLHLAVAAGVKQFLFISVIQPELSADLDIVAAREALVRDMAAAPIPHTVVRATGFFSDMGEFLDMAKGGRVYMAGIVTPFLEKANRVTKVAVMTHDRTLARLHFEPNESPYSFIAMVPQDVTEKLLVEELRRQGGSVEYETNPFRLFPRTTP